MTRQPSRSSKIALDITEAVVKAITSNIHALVEASRDAPEWTLIDHVVLPLLQGPGSRLRRVPPTWKRLVASETALEQGVRTPGQFCAATKIINRRLKKLRSATTFSAKTPRACRIHEDNCMQYLMASRRCFQDTKHVFFTCDGIRVNNVDILLVAVGCPEKHITKWSPPQAPS